VREVKVFVRMRRAQLLWNNEKLRTGTAPIFANAAVFC
jgi:hypothetical protein